MTLDEDIARLRKESERFPIRELFLMISVLLVSMFVVYKGFMAIL